MLSLPTLYYVNKNSKLRALKFRAFDEIITQSCQKFTDLKKSQRQDIIMKIESGCYSKTLQSAEKNNIYSNWDDHRFVALYNDICYAALSKLSDDPNLIIRMIVDSDPEPSQSKIDASKLAFMSCEEFAPELYKQHKDRYNMISNICTQIKFSELHTCYRCKHNQCTVETNPCRSADEQIPLRITCMFCGNKWSG